MCCVGCEGCISSDNHSGPPSFKIGEGLRVVFLIFFPVPLSCSRSWPMDWVECSCSCGTVDQITGILSWTPFDLVVPKDSFSRVASVRIWFRVAMRADTSCNYSGSRFHEVCKEIVVLCKLMTTKKHSKVGLECYTYLRRCLRSHCAFLFWDI